MFTFPRAYSKVEQNETHVLQQGGMQRIKDVVQVMNEKMGESSANIEALSRCSSTVDMDLVNTLPKHPYILGGSKLIWLDRGLSFWREMRRGLKMQVRMSSGSEEGLEWENPLSRIKSCIP